MHEARMERTPDGLVPEDDGWFVVNVADAAWRENARFGQWCSFEGKARFPHFGINIHVILPGQPNCLYHREDQQEDFLILFGECLLLVEGQERQLGQWDFVHCAPNTEHVFVGAGDGPCGILMVGHRDQAERIFYPEQPLAARHGAAAAEATTSPRQAYANAPESHPSGAPAPFRR